MRRPASMRFIDEGKLLRVFIGGSDRFDGRPLYEAMVDRARGEGLAGATVVRGVEGFAASSHLHVSRFLRLSQDVPIIIEIVDTPENVDRIMPLLDQMMGDGMMTVETVQMRRFRTADAGSSQVVGDRLRILTEEARAPGSERDHRSTLSASMRAVHEYGASPAQIASATGIPVADVIRILGAGRDRNGSAP
jgi:PII-like signaling protein